MGRKYHWLVSVAFLLFFPVAITAAQEAQEVTVTLKEWEVGFKELTIPPGKIRFTITNAGTTFHAFALQGKGRSKNLSPGESTIFLAELSSGEYEVYCPLPGHKEQGMVGKVIVQKGEAVKKKAPAKPQPTRPAYY